MKATWRFGTLVLTLMLPSGILLSQTEDSKSLAAFKNLSSLVGEWKGMQNSQEITLTYRLTADGSVLMEEFRPAKGAAMMTMFSVDGDHLIATHYCSAGNQPQMTTKTIVEPQSGTFVFSVVRVTGMATPEDWHNTGLEVLLKDKDHFTQKWSYSYRGRSQWADATLAARGESHLPKADVDDDGFRDRSTV
jgi:hypothetical protein